MRSPRFRLILVLLVLASFLNSLDRQTLSVLKQTLMTAIGFDNTGYAFLVNVFTLCYAGSYVASGWFADRLGNRVSLAVMLSVWSLATLGCSAANGLLLFTGCRALLGAAEPGLFPVSVRAITLWVPAAHRALFMNLSSLGVMLGGIFAPPLIAMLATGLSWRMAFLLPGAAGLVLSAIWWFAYRDPETPAEAGSGSSAEAMPWARLWAQPALWAIVLARFISDPVWYYCLYWMPGYFQARHGLSLSQLGWVAWIPYCAASVGGLLCAALSDRLARRGDPVRARRRLLVMLACLGPCAALVPFMPSLALTLLALSLVGVVCQGWFALLCPLVADLFPAGNVASVWGITGAFGALGAMIFNHQIGRLSGSMGQDRLFFVMAGLHLLALLPLAFARRPALPPAGPSLQSP
jgi:ACS family hexuronate transporter-like MFS transporter